MKVLKISALVVFALWACLIAAPCSFAAAPLHVAVSGPYPPFLELDAEGNVFGFDVDITNAVCKELKRECTIENMEFSEIIPAILDGRVDFAVAGMGSNAERRKVIDFTDRYYRSVSIFIERRGTFKEISREALKGRRIGVQAESLQAEYIASTYGAHVTLVLSPSYEAIFELLKEGKVDLVFSEGLPGYTYLSSAAGSELEAIGTPLEAGGELDWSLIALAKNREDLREAINKALQTLRRSGEYDRINRKYFEFIIY